MESSLVVQVEHDLACDDSRAHGGDAIAKDLAGRVCTEAAVERIGDGDEGGGDRRGAGAAVGVQHVGVDVNRAGAERLAVDDGAETAADQALDLGRPPVGAAANPRRSSCREAWRTRR